MAWAEKEEGEGWRGLAEEKKRECMRLWNNDGSGGNVTLLCAPEGPSVKQKTVSYLVARRRRTATLVRKRLRSRCSASDCLRRPRHFYSLCFRKACALKMPWTCNNCNILVDRDCSDSSKCVSCHTNNQLKLEVVESFWSLPWNQTFLIGEMEIVGVWLDVIWFLQTKIASDLTWLQLNVVERKGWELGFWKLLNSKSFWAINAFSRLFIFCRKLGSLLISTFRHVLIWYFWNRFPGQYNLSCHFLLQGLTSFSLLGFRHVSSW